MIIINLSSEGDINITKESLEERIAMSDRYLDLSSDGESDDGNEEQTSEQLDAKSYQLGWAAAANLAAVAYEKGEIKEFLSANSPVWNANDWPTDKSDRPVGKISVNMDTPGHLVQLIGQSWLVGDKKMGIVGFKRKESGLYFDLIDPDLAGALTEKGETPEGARRSDIPVPNDVHFDLVEQAWRPKIESADDAVLFSEIEFVGKGEDESAPPEIRPAVDSGEPEKEIDPKLTEGSWTISEEELNSRLEAANEAGYQKGFANGQTVGGGQTTKRSLRMMAVEWLKMDDDDLVDPSEYTETNGEQSVDIRFVEYLARRLGYKITD